MKTVSTIQRYPNCLRVTYSENGELQVETLSRDNYAHNDEYDDTDGYLVDIPTDEQAARESLAEMNFDKESIDAIVAKMIFWDWFEADAK